MTRALLILGVIGTLVVTANGAGEEDYWETIASLAKKGTPRGNPELRAYLETLTRDQMLTAARQYARIAQGTIPPDEGAINVGLALAYYREPSGGLSDESLDKLLAIIADDNETEFLRYALANMLYGGFFGFPRRFADGQEERVSKSLISVLRNKAAPKGLRRACGMSLRGLLQETYGGIVSADPAVRELHRSDPRMGSRRVFSLIDAGEVQLAGETKARLVEPRKRIHAFREALSIIARDEGEPAEVRHFAEVFLQWTMDLPLLELKSEDSNDEQPRR